MCNCDFIRPDVFDCIKRKANKEHKCSECGVLIKKSSEYWEISGLWEGKWANYKQCLDCNAVGDYYNQENECTYPLGDLYQELIDADILNFDEEIQKWESSLDEIQIVNQEPLKCVLRN